MKKKTNEFILEYDMFLINILAMALLLLMIVVTFGLIKILPAAYMDLFFDRSIVLFEGVNTLIAFIVLILWLILHEIIHSIGYVIYGAKYEKIVYGVCLEKGVLYCLCKRNINKKNLYFRNSP